MLYTAANAAAHGPAWAWPAAALTLAVAAVAALLAVRESRKGSNQ